MKEHLDISIQSADKYLTTDVKIEKFLESELHIEQKTDGIKLTLIKKSNYGSIHDYIFSYKGNILYLNEFDYLSSDEIRNESIGASQFKLVFEHFKTLKKNNIPVGTELFIEFLMSKPTLSSNYTVKHKMVLIGYSSSSWEESFGKLKTKHSGIETANRAYYAELLNIDIPEVLFNGYFNEKLFEQGIISDILKQKFYKIKQSISWTDKKKLLSQLKTLFLSIDSRYGGKEEGVVISSNDMLLKWQQDYQLDKESRLAIKMKYKDDDESLESLYWKNVSSVAISIVDGMLVKDKSIDELMNELSNRMKLIRLDFSHSKKSILNVMDDIQLTAKTQILKRLPGNNNALIVGKFRILTEYGHVKIINEALKHYDNVVICIVTSKENKHTKDLRERMILKTFPNANVIHAINGNLIRIIQKSPININAVVAGTDRVETYKKQLENSLGINVIEISRDEYDISASKIMCNISDINYFKLSTPQTIHEFYEELLKEYGQNFSGESGENNSI